MNKVLEDMKELLEEQLKKINRKGDAITPQELDSAYKAIDILKDIETIYAMKKADEQYSYEKGGTSYGRYPYMTDSYEYGVSRMEPYSRTGRDRDGDGRYSEESYARGRNPMTGRYVSRDSYDRGSYERGYSNEEKEHIKKTLEDMKNKIDMMN